MYRLGFYIITVCEYTSFYFSTQTDRQTGIFQKKKPGSGLSEYERGATERRLSGKLPSLNIRSISSELNLITKQLSSQTQKLNSVIRV